MSSEITKRPTPLYQFDAPPLLSALGTWKPRPSPAPKPFSKVTANPLKIRIVTYNVWFDAGFKDQRTRALLDAVAKEEPDICCFQEVTTGFEQALRQHAFWRKNFVMTSLGDQAQLTRSWYGTLIMVKKSLLEKGGLDISVCFVDFPGSTTGRLLTMLELGPQGKAPSLRVGCIHFDYTPELRAAHMDICMQAFDSTNQNAASILCGDTNTTSYAEIHRMRDGGYDDAWLAIHPEAIETARVDGVDPLVVDPTYGKFGIRVDHGARPARGDEFPRRLDLTLCKGLTVKGCKLVGDKAIPMKDLQAGTPGEIPGDIMVWPSDHVGVCTDVEWAL